MNLPGDYGTCLHVIVELELKLRRLQASCNEQFARGYALRMAKEARREGLRSVRCPIPGNRRKALSGFLRVKEKHS